MTAHGRPPKRKITNSITRTTKRRTMTITNKKNKKHFTRKKKSKTKGEKEEAEVTCLHLEHLGGRVEPQGPARTPGRRERPAAPSQSPAPAMREAHMASRGGAGESECRHHRPTAESCDATPPLAATLPPTASQLSCEAVGCSAASGGRPRSSRGAGG